MSVVLFIQLLGVMLAWQVIPYFRCKKLVRKHCEQLGWTISVITQMDQGAYEVIHINDAGSKRRAKFMVSRIYGVHLIDDIPFVPGETQ